jgi:2-haloalkanoic acid dehalogenase type II
MAPALTDFDVLTFDCYGTLIDWEAGIWDALQPLLAANPGAPVSRRALLKAFGVHESRLESEAPGTPYEEILAGVHAALAGQFELRTTSSLDAGFGASIPHWPAFPDTAEALRTLQERFRLAILSNVSRAGIEASNRKLGVTFDAIYTAEEIGSYKPSLVNFEYMLGRLQGDHGIEADDVLHTAQSLFHDHAPAKSLGLTTAWIDRQRLSEGGGWGATARVEEPPEPDFTFFTLGEMAAAASR